MDWKGARRSGNIEDRRGMGGGAIAGGGIGAVVLAAIGYFVFGIDPQTTMQLAEQMQGQTQTQQDVAQGQVKDENGQFVDAIETSNTAVWGPIFAAQGARYTPPESVVLYDNATQTGCGTGQSAMGPFYCPADRKVYLDLTFWNDLESKFGAKGEFARAYVISHEVGHHVQTLLGASEASRRLGARGAESGSVRLELQADCYAGVWASRAGETSGGQIVINPADIEDGLGAAAAVGDDTIQSRSQGQVVPDSFTHGTSEQRMRWFTRGYERGDPAVCDTFGASRL